MIKTPITKILFLDIETVGLNKNYDECVKNNPKIAHQFEQAPPRCAAAFWRPRDGGGLHHRCDRPGNLRAGPEPGRRGMA